MLGRAPLVITLGALILGLSTVHAEPTVEFTSPPDVIGQSQCSDSVTDNLTLTVEANTIEGVETYSLELVLYTSGNSICLDSLTTCPEVIIDDEGACGCLQSDPDNPQTLTWTGSLASLDSQFVTLLCGSSTTISFRGDIVYDSDLADETSETVSLETDLDAPSAPAGGPIVRAAENALIVSLEASDRTSDDVTEHEICVKRAGADTAEPTDDATPTDGTAPTLTELRAGFTEASCKRTSDLKTGDYRYEGLENKVRYTVVVAAFDAAGNRSANSEAVDATPASLLDFAELYAQRLGDAEGEAGGCSTAPTRTDAIFCVVCIVGLIQIRRSRS